MCLFSSRATGGIVSQLAHGGGITASFLSVLSLVVGKQAVSMVTVQTGQKISRRSRRLILKGRSSVQLDRFSTLISTFYIFLQLFLFVFVISTFVCKTTKTPSSLISSRLPHRSAEKIKHLSIETWTCSVGTVRVNRGPGPGSTVKTGPSSEGPSWWFRSCGTSRSDR